MRTCLFCSASANSLEDAWPRWIVEQFRSEQPAVMQAERRGVALKPWKVYHPSMPIKCVCRECNNGWMSRLETDAQPHIQPLLMGDRVHLDRGAQGIVALWVVKTAMVMEAQDPPDLRGYTETERRQLSRLSAMPWRSAVWLSASADPSYFLGIKNRHISPDEECTTFGTCTTMSFAHISMQTLRMQVPPDVGPETRITASVRRGDWADSTIQIWPPQADFVHWPPRKGLNGELGLNLLADRFSVGQLAPDAVENMAV